LALNLLHWIFKNNVIVVIGFRWLEMYDSSFMFYSSREFRVYSNMGKWHVCWEIQTDGEVNNEFAKLSQDQ
jgi:hypothetical protein